MSSRWLRQGLELGNRAGALVRWLVLAGLATHSAFALERPVDLGDTQAYTAAATSLPGKAAQRGPAVDFKRESASAAARQTAGWILDSGDNGGLPFMIVDKIEAKVFLFDARGDLRGAAAALLGLAPGDASAPGIGERPLSRIRPDERTTPAGRFVATLGRNLQGTEILWIDYDLALSLHPVITTNGAERRAQRLATPTPSDNRISYGWVNVPARYFKQVVRPAFKGTAGIVYILPETQPAQALFGRRSATPNQP